MLSACVMTDLPSQGTSFTWEGRRGNFWIQCKLDRVFGNKEWFKHFPMANQSFLDKRGSDHRPVLLSLVSSQILYRSQFRFDKCLLGQNKVKEAVERAWNVRRRDGNESVFDKLRGCRKALSLWKKENSLDARDKIQQIEVALEFEQSCPFPNCDVVYTIKNDLSRAYREEEIYWQQKSREHWLRDVDRNTKFFHASVKGNRGEKESKN